MLGLSSGFSTLFPNICLLFHSRIPMIPFVYFQQIHPIFSCKKILSHHDIAMRYITNFNACYTATFELFQCNLAVPDHRDHRRISAAERILPQQLLSTAEYTPFGRKLFSTSAAKEFSVRYHNILVGKFLRPLC